MLIAYVEILENIETAEYPLVHRQDILTFRGTLAHTATLCNGKWAKALPITKEAACAFLKMMCTQRDSMYWQDGLPFAHQKSLGVFYVSAPFVEFMRIVGFYTTFGAATNWNVFPNFSTLPLWSIKFFRFAKT